MSLSEDFVESLKIILQEKKNNQEFKKNILQESLNFCIDFLKLENDFIVKSIKDYDSKYSSFYVDVLSDQNLAEKIKFVLQKNYLKIWTQDLSDFKSIFLIDLGPRLVISGSQHNLVFVEIVSKKYSQYKLKFTLCNPGVNFSVFEKNFYYVKFWTYELSRGFSVYELKLNGLDRNKKKHKIQTEDKKFQVSMNLNDMGEFVSLVVKKSGEKNKN